MPYPPFFAALSRALAKRTYTITNCAPAYPSLTEVRVQQLAHAEAGTIYRNHRLTTTAFAQSTAATDVTYVVGNSQLAAFLATIETFDIVKAEARVPLPPDPMMMALTVRRVRQEQEERDRREVARKIAASMPPPEMLIPGLRRYGK